MIDFHSHILPGMDDGSKNVEESLQILKLMAEQGIDRVAATPHFYASLSGESPEEFLIRRNTAEEMLRERIKNEEGLPQIFCGAEVKYFRGMSGVEDLKKLTLQGTELLLVEMPFEKWSDKVIKEVLSLNEKLDVIPVLAHIERYFSYQKNLDWIYDFKKEGILMQMNAEYILGAFSSRKAIKLINNYAIDFLGSDTHNMTNRKPNLGPAIQKIERKADEEIIDRFLHYEQTYSPRG